MRATPIVLFIIAAVASALSQASADMYLSALPAIGRDLQSSTTHVQLTITCFTLGLMLAQLTYGPISDGLGRRVILISSLLLLTVSSLLCATAASLTYLYIGRFLQGLGGGGGVALMRPILRDLFTGQQYARMAGYAGMIGVVPIAISPLLGAYIHTYFDWRAIFIVITTVALLWLVIVSVFLYETNPHLNRDKLKPKVLRANSWRLLTSPVFMGYSLANIAAFSSIYAWLTAGPVVLQDVIGLSPRAYGEVYFICGIMFIVGMFAYTRLVRYFRLNDLLLLGIGCTFFAGTLMLLCYLSGWLNAWVIAGPMMLVFLGDSFIFAASATLAFSSFPDIAGLASALFGSLRMVGASLVSGLLAVIPEINQAPLAITIMVLMTFAFLVYQWLFPSSVSCASK